MVGEKVGVTVAAFVTTRRIAVTMRMIRIMLTGIFYVTVSDMLKVDGR